MISEAGTMQGALVLRRLADYAALTKARVIAMVLVTTAVGFHLGSIGTPDFPRLLQTLLGTALAAGGTLALNQYMERDLDARMERTRRRPLPEGRLVPTEALAVLATAMTVLRRHRDDPALRRPAQLACTLVVLQIALGAFTIWSRRAVLPTTIHLSVGAALLATCLVLALRTRRRIAMRAAAVSAVGLRGGALA